jgi:hypothetical protein
MPALDTSLFPAVAYLALSASIAYGGGRIHQWYVNSMDRDRPFRDGYHHGYRSLFPAAVQGTHRPAGDVSKSL